MKSRVSGTHAYPSSRRALFVFIPTNSDGQKLVNLRKKGNEKNLKKILLSPSFRSVSPSLISTFYFYFSFSLGVGPTCHFIPLLGLFQPRNNLFCPGFNFIYPN